MVQEGAAVYRPGKVLQRETNSENADAENAAAIFPGQPVTIPPNAGAAKYVRGTLTGVDCSAPPLATLTVVAGVKTWKMKVADTNHLVLIGADKFSCAWNKQKVALNYRETSEGEGNVVSLEIQ